MSCWKKGTHQTYTCRCLEFQDDSEKPFLLIEVPDELKDVEGQLLFHFNYGKIIYYGTSIVRNKDSEQVEIEVLDQGHRLETRKNFRVLVYPHHDVRGVFYTGQIEKDQASVINIAWGKKESGIKDQIQDFQTHFPKEDEIAVPKNGMILRVENISVTGLGLRVGKIEVDFFENCKDIKSFDLYINGERITLPGANVVFISQIEDHNRMGVPLYRIGLEFKKVTEQIDLELGRLVNSVLDKENLQAQFENNV